MGDCKEVASELREKLRLKRFRISKEEKYDSSSLPNSTERMGNMNTIYQDGSCR